MHSLIMCWSSLSMGRIVTHTTVIKIIGLVFYYLGNIGRRVFKVCSQAKSVGEGTISWARTKQRYMSYPEIRICCNVLTIAQNEGSRHSLKIACYVYLHRDRCHVNMGTPGPVPKIYIDICEPPTHIPYMYGRYGNRSWFWGPPFTT